MKPIHWILTLLALYLAACGSSSEPGGNGGNTNWLKRCDKNADCGDEDRCVSQVCLKPCDSADACGVQNTACEALEPAKLTAAGACETQEAANFCTLKCDKDRDCRTLRGAFTCEEGRCQSSCTALLAVGDADGGVQDAGTKEQPSEAGAGKDGLPSEAGAGKDGLPSEAGVGKDGLPSEAGAACDPRLGCEGDTLRCSAEDCNVMGTCVPPEKLDCNDGVYEPVCACNGITYGNLCVAGGATIEQSGECGGDEPGKSPGECLLVGNAEACCPELLAVDREELDSNPCLFEIIGGEYQIPEEVIAECPPPPCPPVTCVLDEKRLNGVAVVEDDGTCAVQPDCDGPNCAGDSCDPSVGCPSDTLVCEAASCGASGVCRRRPAAACDDVYSPVCGCDGQSYSNACNAGYAPVDYVGECVSACSAAGQGCDDASCCEGLACVAGTCQLPAE